MADYGRYLLIMKLWESIRHYENLLERSSASIRIGEDFRIAYDAASLRRLLDDVLIPAAKRLQYVELLVMGLEDGSTKASVLPTQKADALAMEMISEVLESKYLRLAYPKLTGKCRWLQTILARGEHDAENNP